MGERPDFATIYRNSALAPRMAARLWAAAEIAYDEFSSGSFEARLDDLPRLARLYADDEFIAAFRARFDVLAHRLAVGDIDETVIATCTADEIALHIVFEDAEAMYTDGFLDWDWIEALPERPDDDDFFVVKEILFEDFDFESLYDPAMDGAEDPESELSKRAGIANLHPRDWFKPFRS